MTEIATILKLRARLIDVGPVTTIPGTGRKTQRLLFTVNHSDIRIKTDYFGVFVYGDDILKTWENYNDKEPPRDADIVIKLNGRLSANGNNTLTLTLKKITWNYY